MRSEFGNIHFKATCQKTLQRYGFTLNYTFVQMNFYFN